MKLGKIMVSALIALCLGFSAAPGAQAGSHDDAAYVISRQLPIRWDSWWNRTRGPSANAPWSIALPMPSSANRRASIRPCGSLKSGSAPSPPE